MLGVAFGRGALRAPSHRATRAADQALGRARRRWLAAASNGTSRCFEARSCAAVRGARRAPLKLSFGDKLAQAVLRRCAAGGILIPCLWEAWVRSLSRSLR